MLKLKKASAHTCGEEKAEGKKNGRGGGLGGGAEEGKRKVERQEREKREECYGKEAANEERGRTRAKN